tara:strand:- start:184 stop:492 length:309 start_codon:yes stop_codon:yes gene_type:complete
MKITKRQLKRIVKEEYSHIIKEVSYTGNSNILEITQDNYNRFVEIIASGYGWIDADDVERQWTSALGVQSLSPAALQYLIANLDTDGLIAGHTDLDTETEEW